MCLLMCSYECWYVYMFGFLSVSVSCVGEIDLKAMCQLLSIHRESFLCCLFLGLVRI